MVKSCYNEILENIFFEGFPSYEIIVRASAVMDYWIAPFMSSLYKV